MSAPTQTTYAIAVDKLQATLSQVITTMLGIGMDESNLFEAGEEVPQPVFHGETLSSSVRFSGAFRGSLVVSCDPEVARELTYRFLGLESTSADAILGEIKDCMGEVANIVGGNLKNILPRGVDHSVPVFGGSTAPEGEPLISVAFKCNAGPLWISLIREA